MQARQQNAPVAVIDFGTNSTRLLVCTVARGQVTEFERLTTVTRLGEGVDSTNRLTDAAMERVATVIARYREVIDHYEAGRVVALATSAVRDARNAEGFRQSLRERFGLEVRTISGEEEARLTFLGATSRRELSAPTMVVDVGGGSTEFVVGTAQTDPDFHVSTQIGSVRQTERHLGDDPPTAEQTAAAAEEVRSLIARAVPREVRARVGLGIAVAGTATTLAAIDQALEPYDPRKIEGYELGLSRCQHMLEELASLPLAQRRAVAGLHPDRAPTVVAGAIILIETMRAFSLDAVEASEADILHGAAIRIANTPKG